MAMSQGDLHSDSSDRVQAIANAWYQCIAQTAFVPISLPELRRRLSQLVGDALALFHADHFMEEKAQAIGAALVDLHLAQAETLGKSVEVLARELPADLAPEQLASMQPKLSALLGGITQGYFRQAAELILKEQESVRQANVTTLNALFTERQKQKERLGAMHEQMQVQLAERTRIQQALSRSEAEFRALFEESPVVLWVVDGSQFYQHLLALKEAGVDDFQSYFEEHPDVLSKWASLLYSIDVNKAAVRTTGFASKEELLQTPIAYWGMAMEDLLLDWAAAFTSQKTSGGRTLSGLTPEKEPFAAIYHWSVPLGFQTTYSRIILSFIDITAQREMERKLQQTANRLNAIHKIESGILQAESPQAIAEIALQHIEPIIPATASAVTLFQNSYTELLVLASRNSPFLPGYVMPADPEETSARKRNTPLIIDDVAAIPRKTIIMEMLEKIGGRSLMQVPLLMQDKLIGTINFMDHHPFAFQEKDAVIAQQIGNSVAIAIHNSSLLEQEKRARREAETLREVAGKLGTSIDLEELLDLILVQLERVLPYDRATILLTSDDKLTIRAQRGIEFDLPENFIHNDQLPHNILAIIQEQRPLIIADTASDPNWVIFKGGEFVRCSLGVPLSTKVDFIGLLLIDKDEPHFYKEEDATLALAFANHAAVAIENAHLYRDVQQYANNLERRVLERTRELEALYDITAIASRYLDLQETLELIISVIARRLNCAAISIQTLDESGNTLHLVAEKGLTPSMHKYLEVLPVNHSILSQVLEDDEPIIYLNPSSVSELSDVPLPAESTYGFAAPIKVLGENLGILGMGYDGHETPTREDLALINSIADHIGVAIENERLRKQSEQLAVLEERDRLARDLHDSATQSLFSLTLFAAAAREHLQNGQLDLVNSQLEELQETAVQTHKEMRLLIYELRPKILENRGLEEALRQRMQLVEFRSGVQSEINADLNITLPVPVQEVLFQVASEALNNTLKHSGADSVSIDIRMDDGQVAMQIKDNGLGFSTDDIDFSAGLGLDIMRERIQALNGTFNYDSEPDAGTTISAKIPLELEDVPKSS